MRPQHPRMKEIRNAPAGAAVALVPKLGGEYIPMIANPKFQGDTQDLEVTVYQEQYNPRTPYMKMVEMLDRPLKDMFGYTNQAETQAMAAAVARPWFQDFDAG